uniref:WAP domain-containing protein n=1 Tax=Magallana gigas TaxID=29159 RepID=A0A8W8J3D6_MAGGI
MTKLFCIVLLELFCLQALAFNTLEKPGLCPPETPGVETICLLGCLTDVDCPGFQKCCRDGCYMGCQNPVFGYQHPSRYRRY